MDASHQVLAQSVMHGAVTLDPVQVLERVRADDHMVMAFPALLISGMTAMAFAVIANQKFPRRESRDNFSSISVVLDIFPS